MVGMGLLEAIPEARLRELADPGDADGDGISGRLGQVWDAATGAPAVGRFGWKAEQPSVRAQVTGAFLGDIGITTGPRPVQECSVAQAECLAAPAGGAPELADDLLDKVVLYSQTLAVPVRTRWDDAEVLRGKALFARAGCAGCHTPSHLTRADAALPELAGQRIFPYTDLLLHDLGEALSDRRPVFAAAGSEWRTAPLWGLRLIAAVNQHERLLHDGRARGVAEAILWHGGEAVAAREAFRMMAADERAALLAFVGSL